MSIPLFPMKDAYALSPPSMRQVQTGLIYVEIRTIAAKMANTVYQVSIKVCVELKSGSSTFQGVVLAFM
jgi:hypothetical protein